MRTTQQLSITLPFALAEAVKTKVASGEYASESEVIREGLRALIAQDRAIDNWLFESMASALDRTQADPSRLLTAEQVRAELAAQRRATPPSA